MVHNFSMPVGGNLLNSIRIDNVRRSIVSLGFKQKKYTDFLRNAAYDMPKEEYGEKLLFHQTQVKDAAGTLENTRTLLDQEDLEFLNDRSQSAPFWDFATTQLGGNLSGELYEFITYRRIQIRRDAIYK